MLLRGLAKYEHELSSCKTTDEMLLATLSLLISVPDAPLSSAAPAQFTQGHARTLLVSPANSPNTIFGITVYCPNYSTWSGPGIYIEDMIITSSQRGKGYARALLSALARKVRGAGGARECTIASLPSLEPLQSITRTPFGNPASRQFTDAVTGVPVCYM
jgi:GNAT superfamily N-acetyltransferase